MDGNVQKETNATSPCNILKDLELENYYPGKISLQDVMTIGESQQSKTANGQLAWTILQNLIMLGRNVITSNIEKTAKQNESSDDLDNLESLLEDESQLHPSDIFVAIFLCCDLNLRQMLTQKMYKSRLAFPFILPDIKNKELTYNLWGLRTSFLVWRDTSNKAVESSAVSYPVKAVSCIRLHRPNFSKSKFLNNILSDQGQETFLNKDSLNGNKERNVTGGLVEASFFLPDGRKTDKLDEPIVFLNLRGDGTKHEQQVCILSQASNIIFVCLDISDLDKDDVLKKMMLIHQHCTKVVLLLCNCHQLPREKIKDSLQKYSEKIGKKSVSNTTKILTFTLQMEKNAAQMYTEAMDVLKKQLKDTTGRTLQDLSKVMSERDILVDQSDKHCQKGKELADEVMTKMKEWCKPLKNKESSKEKEEEEEEDSKEGPKTERQTYADEGKTKMEEALSKAALLPLQGETWQEWCKLLKDKKRPKEKEGGIKAGSQNEPKMKDYRQKQESLCDTLNPSVQTFIDGLTASSSTRTIDFYLQWLKLYLDDISRDILPALHRWYLATTTELKKVKKTAEPTDTLEAELRYIEKSIEDVTLGVEHLMRELSQIYEAAHVSCKRFKDLPKFAAELLLKGESLEIMDGDASGVPEIWLDAVFTELEKLIQKKKLFTLSVVGIQSSGKSTLLNTMFGLQFPVSAGRCTKGVYMQLIKVNYSKELPFSYVAVFDSEGLRGQKLGESKYDHDNELATFVIGLGNVTLINMKGESLAEINEILQIVSHAFLRMKMVNEPIQKDRSCVFVHQNVSAVDAETALQPKMKNFQDTLDRMTVQAASLENMSGIHSFHDVIQFKDKKDVWYFPDLWYGEPPMASVNAGYHESAKDLRDAVLTDISTEPKCIFGVHKLKNLIRDMWHGVLADDFVYSFRNGMVTKAYDDLDEKYSELKWRLELSMKEWINNIKWENHSTRESLHTQCKRFKAQAADLGGSEQQKLVSELLQFIKTNDQCQILVHWKKEKEISLRCAAESILASGRRSIDDMAEKEAVNILRNKEKDKHEAEILKKARCLAEEKKGRSSLANLKTEFDKMWNEWIDQIEIRRESKVLPISKRLEDLLSDEFPHARHIVKKELHDNPLSRRSFNKSLAKSLTKLDIGVEVLKEKLVKTEWGWNLFHVGKSEDPKEPVIKEIVLIFEEVEAFLQRLSQTASGFDEYNAQEALRIVKRGIKKLNDDIKVPFSIPTNVNIQLVAMVAGYSLGIFQKMQTYYDQHHGVKAQLEAYKCTTWNLFMNVVNQAAEEKIVVDMICDEIKQKMEETISKQLQLEVETYIVPHFTTKSKLLKAILRSLAEKESFKDFQTYIHRAKSFSIEWMGKYIDTYIFSDNAGPSWYLDHARCLIQKTIDGINKSIEKASSASKTNPATKAWIDKFSREMSSVMAFRGTSASLIAKNEKCDVGNLEARFAKSLNEVQKATLRCFTQHTMKSVKWIKKAPHEEIVNSLWGCEAVCPFCEEPCMKSGLDHASQSDCHKSIQHRPQGVSNRRWKYSKKLVVENCSYTVQSTASFCCHDTEHKCELPERNVEVYHPYKEYKKYILHWEIPSSPDMDSSHYWMWCLNKFQKEFAEAANADLPTIPLSWPDITKGSAIKSLSSYD